MNVKVEETEVKFQVGQVRYRLRLYDDLSNNDLHFWDYAEGGWMRVRHNFEFGGHTAPRPTAAVCATLVRLLSRTLKETLPTFAS